MDYDGVGVMEYDQIMNCSSYLGMEAVETKARSDIRNTNGVARTMNEDLHCGSLCKGEDVSDGTAEYAGSQIRRGDCQNVRVTNHIDRGTMIVRNDLDVEQGKVLSIGARQSHMMSMECNDVRRRRTRDVSGGEDGEVTAIDESCSSYVEQGRVLSVDARLSFGNNVVVEGGSRRGAEDGEVTAIDESCSSYVEQGRVLSVDARLSFDDDAVAEGGSRRGAVIDFNGEVQLGSSDNEQGRVVSIARQSLNDIAKLGTSGRSSDGVQVSWAMHVMLERSVLTVVAWTAGAAVEQIAEVPIPR